MLLKIFKIYIIAYLAFLEIIDKDIIINNRLHFTITFITTNKITI